MLFKIGDIAQQLGISMWLLVIILVWSGVWKFLALWKSARQKSIGWFLVFALVNTMGILEIFYIFVFSKCCKKKLQKQNTRRKKRR